MVPTNGLFAGLVLLATFALAQTTAPVAFTSVPAVVVAGTHYNISWGGGDGSPVTLTLRKGDPQNLATIGVLADGVQGNSYDWKVSDRLQSATDYALQITQGQASINYSGQFTITGASNSTVSSSVTSSTTGTAGIDSNVTATRSGTLYTTSTLTLTLMPNSGPTGKATTTTSATSTTGASPTAKQTSAPSANGAVQYSSSAALVMVIMGTILFLN